MTSLATDAAPVTTTSMRVCLWLCDVNTLMKQTMPATHACMPSLLLNMPLYMRAQDTVWLAVEDQHGQPIDYHTFSARLTTLCTQH